MDPFPHHYAVETHLEPARDTVTLRAPGLPPLETAPPREFGGSGDHWSPETLLIGAVADCFVLSFRAIAEASRFEWQRLEVKVDGTLDRIERKTQFTELNVRARVKVPGSSESSAMRILEKSEAACLITNSLTAKVNFEGEVEVAA
jgi:organic hydroperoxide reductase OsmC/OhrA